MARGVLCSAPCLQPEAQRLWWVVGPNIFPSSDSKEEPKNE